MIEVLAMVAQWAVIILVGFITFLIFYARKNYGTLEKISGLTGIVKPYFIGGSDPFAYKKIVCHIDMENAKKYGSAYGFYEGNEAQIFITDPELIRQVLIKDFSHFTDKRKTDFGHELLSETMDILPYDKWKVVRSHFSPQLTTSRMRSMSTQILEGIKDWIKHLEKKLETTDELDAKDIYTALSTDNIARCAFGSKINAFENPNNEFVQHVNAFSLDGYIPNFRRSLIQIYPFFTKLEPFRPQKTMEFFGNLLRTILSERKKSDVKIDDFLDSMNSMMDKIGTETYKKLGIEEKTVMCQAIIFLFAGLETISQALTLLSSHLANNPKIQEKLIAEVDEYFRKNGEIKQETISELVYLNACLNETLRLNTPLIRLERVCQKNWTYNGLSIKKGTVVQIPMYPIHLNEKFYPDPHKFKPERFMPENKDKLVPYTFMAFGDGPHNCIGMRFTREEIQMTMASILRKYKILPTNKTEIKMMPGRFFLSTFLPITIKFQKR